MPGSPSQAIRSPEFRQPANARGRGARPVDGAQFRPGHARRLQHHVPQHLVEGGRRPAAVVAGERVPLPRRDADEARDFVLRQRGIEQPVIDELVPRQPRRPAGRPEEATNDPAPLHAGRGLEHGLPGVRHVQLAQLVDQPALRRMVQRVRLCDRHRPLHWSQFAKNWRGMWRRQGAVAALSRGLPFRAEMIAIPPQRGVAPCKTRVRSGRNTSARSPMPPTSRPSRRCASPRSARRARSR